MAGTRAAARAAASPSAEPARGEWLTLGLTQAGWGLLPIFGLVWVDATLQRVDWNTFETWSWLALLAAMFAVGAAMVVRSGDNRNR